MAAPRRVLVVGACGRMGERVRAALAGEPSLRLAAALEAPGHPQLGAELAPGVPLRDDLEAALARLRRGDRLQPRLRRACWCCAPPPRPGSRS